MKWHSEIKYGKPEWVAMMKAHIVATQALLIKLRAKAKADA